MERDRSRNPRQFPYGNRWEEDGLRQS